MSQISSRKEKYLIIVAANSLHEKISEHFNGQARNICWCDGVYMALAKAVQMQQKDEPATVCILIDTLCREEMKVFTCLSELSGITTVAFSSLDLHKKIGQAQELGADITTQLSKLKEILSIDDSHGKLDDDSDGIVESALSEPPPPQKPKETKQEIEVPELLGIPQNMPVETMRAQSAQRRQGPSADKDKPAEQENGPLLSDEELNALLG